MNNPALMTFLGALAVWTSCNGRTNTPPGYSDERTENRMAGDTVGQLSNNIMVVFQDGQNNYWLGSWQDGLFKYDGESIVQFTTTHGLPDNRVEEIREDSHGNVLVNTTAGLCRYDGRRMVPVPEAALSMPEWRLRSDDLWFKSTAPGHVWRYDGKSVVSLEIPKSEVGEAYLAQNPSASDPYGIYCVYTDAKGNVWFGMAMMGALRYNGKSFDWICEPDVTEMHDGPSNGVRSIIEDKDGYFWFNSEYRYALPDSAGAEGKFSYRREKSIGNLDGKENSSLHEYLSIARDDNDHLWMATYRNGVWKYDGNAVTHYPVQENGVDIHLFCIYKDNSGGLWLGTHENGLWKLTGDAFTRFTPR